MRSRKIKHRLIRASLRYVDPVLSLVVYPAALLMKIIRFRIGRMPFCKRALLRAGVFPLVNHYYEPLFDPRALRHQLDQDRNLIGIDWNVEQQLQLLTQFTYNSELVVIPEEKKGVVFQLDNISFGAGDFELLYNMIRLKKPKRVLEIGSGHSTIVASRAISRNASEHQEYRCRHTCIEPYEMPWLEEMENVTVLRELVENVDKDLFLELEEDDILFINSSHVIRPQGDVLFEYLEILPSLKRGVIVHVHDIFSPRDYPKKWIIENVHFWNEQYLVEAFLIGNRNWKILAALNYLKHHHFELLRSKAPFLDATAEPSSLYIQKI